MSNAPFWRCVFFTIAIVLCCQGTAVTQESSKENPSTATIQPEQQKAASELPPLLPGAVQDQSTEAHGYQPSCDKPKQRDDADFCQQQRMANATEKALWLNELQIWIAAAAGILSFISALAAAYAAYEASRAANAANDSVKVGQDGVIEARRANKIAEDNTRLERQKFLLDGRPFIFVQPMNNNIREWRSGADAFNWTYRLKNHGRNPAIIHQISSCLILSDILPSHDGFYREAEHGHGAEAFREKIKLEDEKISYGYIINGGEISGEIVKRGSRSLSMENISETIKDERKKLHLLTCGPDILNYYLIVRISYEDVFQNQFVTHACLRLDAPFWGISEQGGKEYNFRT